ncbi:hypothetical protein CC030809_00009 [Synechococcus phage S-CAM7]|uniref:Bacteriophage lysin domain-containing protein n=1 Tax=Synechococcus phage S-CAM7 TaxID=1883368 RepID=A0A7D5JN86_9CAUD|nr:hypothetical protein CC030809_00009 [Synechococcus phage S-CAM7]
MAIPLIAAKSLNIAKTLIASSKNVAKGVYSTAASTVNRTGEKIKSTNAKITAEKKKQADINRKKSENESRAAKENNAENTNKKKGAVLSLVGVVKKSIMGFWKIIGAWLLDNLPKIIEEVRKFVKKIRIVGAAIKRAVTLVGSVFSSIGKIAKAVVKNILNFDFTDKSGDIREAREELDASVDGIGSSISEIGTVWGREEDELDYILTQLTSNQNLENIRKNILSEFPEVEKGTSAVGDGSSPSSGGGSSRGDALFDLIGSGEGDYNSVNRGNAGDTPGGAEAIFGKPLTEMTVGQVASAQQSGQVFAVGKYQIIPDTMVEFLRNSPDIKPTDKFDSRTQEKFKEYVINVKRPAIGKYLRGESDDRDAAAQAVAREFASVGLTKAEAGRGRGQSRYAGTGNNAASISPDQVASALDADRSATLSPPQPQAPQPANGQTPAPGKQNAALASSAGRLNKSRLDTSRFGRNGCVFAVNQAYKAAGMTPPWGTTNYVPDARAMMIKKGYVQVGVKNAQPGDIVIMADRGSPPWVHIGIVSNSGTVLHNSSTNQAFTNNESFSSLMRRYVKIEVYRAPSVISRESSNVSNAVNGSKNGKNNVKALNDSMTIASRRTGGTQVVNNTVVLKQDRVVMVS